MFQSFSLFQWEQNVVLLFLVDTSQHGSGTVAINEVLVGQMLCVANISTGSMYGTFTGLSSINHHLIHPSRYQGINICKKTMKIISLMLLLALLVSLAAGQTTYSGSFSTTTNTYTSAYFSNYIKQTLTQGKVLEIKVHFPGYVGSSDATFPPIYGTNIRLEDTLTGLTLVPCTMTTNSPDSYIYTCPIPTTQDYVLRFINPGQPNPASPTLEAFNLILTYYDPNGDLSPGNTNVQIFKVIDVFRDQLTKLIYIGAPGTYRFTLNQVDVLGSASRKIELYKVASQTGNNFFSAGANPNLLTGGTLSPSQLLTHDVTLTETGLYILLFTFPNGFNNVRYSYQSNNYACPYDTTFYQDLHKNFEPCKPPISPTSDLPCMIYNSITQACTRCLAPYQLSNGKCWLTQSCPSRHYIKFGSCYPVSDLCDTFDFFTGHCLTCIDPSLYDLMWGSCIRKQVICGPRQYKVNNICYDVSPLCDKFNPNTGACQTCIAGHQLHQGKSCVKIVQPTCPDHQFLDGRVCRNIQKQCLEFDHKYNLCRICKRGYYPQGPFCRQIICPPRKVPSADGPYCVDVSPLCEKYNIITGDCFSCKNNDHTVQNGVCKQFTSPLAGCQERQRLGYGPCVGPEWFCKYFDLVTMNCIECISGFFLNYQGVCQVNTACQPGYWNDKGFCRALPSNCRQVDPEGQCTACTDQIYTVQKGRCIYKKTCVPGQYLNDNGFCIDNAPNCVFHNPSTGQCIECSAGFDMSGGRCCPTGTTFTNGACTSPQGFLNAQPSRQCKISNPTTGYCIECHPGFEVDFRTMRSCVPL